MKKNTMRYFTVLFYGIVACALIFFVEYTIVNDPRRIIFGNSKMYINPGETVKVPYRTTLTTGNKVNTTWTSSNPDVASVSKDGTIRGYKEGSAKITLQVKSEGVTKKASIEVHTTLNTISVQSVKVSKENLILNVGDTYLLKALLSPTNATNQKVYFNSSDPSIVLVDSSGNIKALKAGRASISILTDDGKFKDVCKVIISDKEVPTTHITLSMKENTITVGEDFTIKTNSYPTNATNKSIMYNSSDSSIASVDEYGNVVGKRPGDVTITATTSSGMHQASMLVHVKEKEVERPKVVEVKEVLLDNTQMKMEVGDIKKLSVKLKPQDVTDTKLVFRSSDEKIISVNEEGEVQALQKGEATIVVTASNGVNAAIKIKSTQKEIPLKDFSIVQTVYEIEEGESFMLPIVLEPSNTTEKEFTYAIQNPKVLSVKDGIVKGLKKGKSTIIVESENHKKIVCTVEVTAKKEEPSLEKIEVESYISMKEGEFYTLVPKLTPDVEETLFYYSSNIEVATIDENGHIEAHKEGYSTITIISLNGEMTTTKVMVEKEEIPVSSIELSKEEIELTVGDSTSLKYKVLPKNASQKSTVLSSSDPSIVFITEDGKILAKKEGNAIVTVKARNGKFKACSIHVNPKIIPVEKVSFKDKRIEMKMGEYIHIKTNIFPLDASEQSLKYSSSDESIASISSSGRITAYQEGKVTITVQSLNGKKDTLSVTVQKREIKATGISFDTDVLYMSQGEKTSVKVTVAPLSVTNPVIQYTVEDDQIASIDKEGYIQAKKSGTTYVKASTQNKVARMKVIVSSEKVLPEKIVFKSSSLIVGTGKSVVAEVGLLPLETTEKEITFKSTRPDIATVDEKGMIKGMHSGTTLIQASTSNGKTVSMEVQVVDYISKIHFIQNGIVLLESNGLYGLIDTSMEPSSKTIIPAYLHNQNVAKLAFIVSNTSPSYIDDLLKGNWVDQKTSHYLLKEMKGKIKTIPLEKEEKLSLGDFSLTLYPDTQQIYTKVERGSEKVLLSSYINEKTVASKIGKVDLLYGQLSKTSPSVLQELKPSYMFLKEEKEYGMNAISLYTLQTFGSKIYMSVPMGITITNRSLTIPDTIKPSKLEIEDGWYTVNDHRYYFENGSYVTGFQKLEWNKESSYFYFDESGKMLEGLQNIPWSGGKDFFYFDQEGRMQTGFQLIDQKKYYFDTNGAMVKDTCHMIQKEKYCFNVTGVCIKGCS